MKRRRILTRITVAVTILVIIFAIAGAIFFTYPYKSDINERGTAILDNKVIEIDNMDWNNENDVECLAEYYKTSIEKNDTNSLETILNQLLIDENEREIIIDAQAGMPYKEHRINIAINQEKRKKLEKYVDPEKNPDEYNLLMQVNRFQYAKNIVCLAEVDISGVELKVTMNQGDILVTVDAGVGIEDSSTHQEYRRLHLDYDYSFEFINNLKKANMTKKDFLDKLMSSSSKADADICYYLYNCDYDKVFSYDDKEFKELTGNGKAILGEYACALLYRSNGEEETQKFINTMIKETKEKNLAVGHYDFQLYLQAIEEYSRHEYKKYLREMNCVIQNPEKNLEDFLKQNDYVYDYKNYVPGEYLDDELLREMQKKLQNKMLLFGLWYDLESKIEPYRCLNIFAHDGRHYEIDILEFYNGENVSVKLCGYLKNENGEILRNSDFLDLGHNNPYKGQRYLRCYINVIWNNVRIKSSMSSYDLTGDKYYLIRDANDFTDLVYKKSLLDEAVSYFFHKSSFLSVFDYSDIHKKAREYFVLDFASCITSGDNRHGDYDVIDLKIASPFVLQNFKKLDEQGLNGISDKKIDIKRLEGELGYNDHCDLIYRYEDFIKDKDEDTIKKFQQCYDKILFGKGSVSILDMDPKIVKMCIEDIDNFLGDSNPSVIRMINPE